ESERMTLVLADRRQVIMRNIEHAYPVTRKTQMTYSGSGYGAGYSQGQRADIGSARLRKRSRRALTSARETRVAGAGVLAAAQQGEEDRIGAVPVRPELGVPAVWLRAAQAGHLGEDGGGVQHLDVVAAAEHVGQHVPGLAAG